MEKKRIVQEGDLVILYERYDRTTAIYVKAGESFQNQLGSFMHNDMIGKPYGSLVRSTTNRWLYMLAPDPFLWSSSLKTRTQIIFPMDTSVIIMNLHIKSGSRVIESGTGSGALSTAFAQCIYPDGHLWTYEYNKYRVEDAKKEFKNNKLDSIITIAYRDVYADGLECKLEDVDNNKELYDRGKKVDAVFLDLPKPWCAIQSAFQCLRKGGRICCFSPCIEQVQKSCEMLREVGFDLIETLEVLNRSYDVQNHGFVNVSENDENQNEEEPVSSEKRAMDEEEDEKASNEEKPLFVPLEPNERWMSQGTHVIRGHTSFLTFASKHKN